ncbi:MAG: TIM barrel protein [Alphaproteobacteria bacterium]|nr:TIM barrel protein [Alphaproteobacteria bacterium]MBP3686996.1 TIM barrel protein [Alphaproteobacteria bacterium]
MRRFGLKLWSKDFVKNIDFVADAEKALKEGKFDYLELFALPFLFEEIKEEVKARFGQIKTIIHASHAMQGLDLAVKEEFDNNKKRLEAAQQFADLLNAEMIILHPGCGVGEACLAESIRQFKAMNDARLTVENLPAYCSQTKRLLHGVTVEEIKRFIEETGAKFCLDFSHAICGANSSKRDIYEVLSGFKALKPSMYHLCDGEVESTNDSHLHYGEGNYDLRRLVREFTDEGALLTMETGHGIPNDVQPWLDDISYIRRVIA